MRDERFESIRRKYTKWVLGLDANTPIYIVDEESKLIGMKMKALKRAINYEEKARKSNKLLIKECIKENERGWGEEREGRWIKARNRLLSEFGIRNEKLRELREKGQDIIEFVIKPMIDKEKLIRTNKIKESNYNRIYQKIYTNKERRMIARYRCGNEYKAKDYWKR